MVNPNDESGRASRGYLGMRVESATRLTVVPPKLRDNRWMYVLRPLSEAEQQLLDALSLVGEDEFRREYEEWARSELAAIADPDDREVFRANVDELRFMYFAQSGESVPSTLYLQRARDGVFFNNTFVESSDETADYFSERSQVISDQRDSLVAARQGAIKSAVSRIVYESPQYQFLSALIDSTNDVREAPLDQLKIFSRKANEDSALKIRNRIPVDRAIDRTSHHALRVERDRIHAAIDRETTQTRTSGNQRERIHHWILASINEHGRKSSDDHVDVVDIYQPSADVSELMIRRVSGVDVPSYVVMDRWSDSLLRQIAPQGLEKHLFRDLTRNFIKLFYLNNGVDARSCLVEAAQQAIERNAHFLTFESFAETSNTSMLLHLKQPQGQIFDTSQTPLRAYRETSEEPDRRITISSWEEVQREKEIILGSITHRDAWDGVTRVIQQEPHLGSQLPAPIEAGEYDLVLNFPNSAEGWLHQGHRPKIGGYELVAHAEDTWAFQRTAIDPYQGSRRLLLPTARLSGLVEQYKSIGLRASAHFRRVFQHPGMTPASLADLVQAGKAVANYTYDTTLQNLSHAKDSSALTLKDFSSYVRDRVLNFQCDGAFEFIRASTEYLLPHLHVERVSGLKLGADELIHASLHAQARVTGDGHDCIIDATPADTGGARNNTRQKMRIRIGEQSKTARVTLTTLVGARLGILEGQDPSDQVVRLHEEDPLRVAFSATANPQQLGASIDYLHAYAGAAPEILKSLERQHGHAYDPGFIQACAQALVMMQPPATNNSTTATKSAGRRRP
ncbi:MAG: hypothetical protein HOQ05_02700 [Corynebacteriales bacterium]|nr:hypothetical protein [Mycobacteriales bacterium]